MRKPSNHIINTILLVLMMTALAFSRPSEDEKYHIYLDSREFEPRQESVSDLNAKAEIFTDQHALIQLQYIPSEAEREILESNGIKLLAYLPNYAWYAHLTTPRIEPTFGIRAIVTLEPNDKISPHIVDRGIAERGFIDEDLASVYVIFFSDVSVEEIETIVAKYGEAVKVMIDVWELTLDQAKLYDLAAEDAVNWIEDIPPGKTTHLNYVRSTIHANEVQQSPYDLHGNGYTVAMWDAGAAWPHTDYSSRLINADGGSTHYHAALVAGIAVGSGVRSSSCGGSANLWRGIATEANLVSYDWSNPTTEHNSAINTYNADISQNAWGWDNCQPGSCNNFGDYDATTRIYDMIVRGIYSDKITIVSSAGNDGQCSTCSPWLPDYPYGTIGGPSATAKNVLAVSCTHANDNSWWSESSRGPTDDGRIKPDIAAPGCKTFNGVVSTYTTNCYSSDYCGTSFASPAVSGSAILMYEEFNNYNGHDPLPSTIRAIFYHTSLDLGNPGPDFMYGYGRIDVQNAIDLIIEDGGLGARIIEDEINHLEELTYEMTVESGEYIFFVTIAWDDKEGVVGAGKELINDLDLELQGPAMDIHYPWVLDHTSPSSSATVGVDDRNNMEQVRVVSPDEGVWTVRITGSLVAYAPQAFTLIGKFEPDGYEYLPGDVNMANGTWPPSSIGGDVTYLVNYFRALPSSQACLVGGFWGSADANGDCMIIGSDVTKLVNYFRGTTDIEYCPSYPPVWPTPDDLPPSAPPGWPNCE
ncbi:MAG: S8 family serine peptidase [candidate division Zixibacteria bacterium]|nr:S8 family serine peptidase [candidate division Zixibacteria bacterium]